MNIIYHRSNQQNPLREGRPLGHITVNGERLTRFNLDQLADREYYDAQVEDPYTSGKMLNGYLFSPNSLVMAHETSFAQVKQRSVGAFSLIGKQVSLAEGIQIGESTEVQSFVSIGEDATIGNRTVLRKSARIGHRTHLGIIVQVGQETTVGAQCNIDNGSVLARNVQLGNMVQIGTQSRVERHSRLHNSVDVKESVFIGEHVRVYDGVLIGELGKVGAYTVIGKGAIVGAEAEIGEMGTLRPSAWIRAGEIVPSPTDEFRRSRYYHRY